MNNIYCNNAKVELVNRPCSVEIYRNAYILPHKKDHSVWGIGGVLDEMGNYVVNSGYDGWFPFGGKYDFDESQISFYDEDIIWFGIFTYHWGHFLVDNVSRMWYVVNNYNNERIAYVSKGKEIDSNFEDFFIKLGIPAKNLLPIKKPSKFRRVIIPEYSKTDYKYFSEFTHIFEKVISVALNQSKPIHLKSKVYLSRLSFRDAQNKEFGEKRIEDFFVEQGFLVLYPEKMSLTEQIVMINNSDTIACINGTIPLNICFLENKNLELIVLNKSAIPHSNLFDFQKIFKISKVSYFDIFNKRYDKYVKSLGNGPFVLQLTKELVEYVSKTPNYDYLNNGMTYKVQEKIFFYKRLFILLTIKLVKKILTIRARIK